MANYNTECLCVRCKHLRAALDPNIQKAYLGKCVKREWPFTLSITLQGWTECEVFEDSGKTYVPPQPVATKAAVAASVAGAEKRVEFYYSSTQKPGETFPCDIKRALDLVKQLQAAGVNAKAFDVAGIKDRFPIYHKAVSGPDASVRPVFGFKGALVEDFGTTVPALLIFEGDRYPVLAFPRNDAQRGTIRVEQALEDLVAETAAPPVVKAVG
ncbi:MAG: hypothetical protein AUG13_03085 [Chloroflexi bacterium 13_1_20CM_2_59_7]|nr:MAG: hypothetical protein AUG13_03085 [Chloroflexi bacterium 13_1_20CM_2_59_7]